MMVAIRLPTTEEASTESNDPLSLMIENDRQRSGSNALFTKLLVTFLVGYTIQ